MPVGSSYAAVKAAIVTKLSARPGLNDVSVIGQPPVKPEDLKGPNGSGKAIWIADAEGSYENVVFLAPDLFLDESYNLKVVIQALPRDSGDTQAITDRRVDEMLYEVLQQAALEEASDVNAWGITDVSVAVRISSGTFRRFCGPYTSTVQFPSRCEFDLLVEDRIQIPGT